MTGFTLTIMTILAAFGQSGTIETTVRITDDQAQAQTERLLAQSEPVFPAPDHAQQEAYLRLTVRDCAGPCLTPSMAVDQAAGAAPASGPLADYGFVVRNVGTDGRGWYINSAVDYRDQRNISIALSPQVQEQLEQIFGDVALAEALTGRAIVARGRPQRVRIDFLGNGQPTGLYYYQTHIHIGDVSQLSRPAGR